MQAVGGQIGQSKNGILMGLLQLRYEHDSSAIQHPTRYVLSSNNEHVNSFALL